MKTITLDWETYEAELKEAKKTGWNSGVYAATEYVKDNTTYCLSRENNFRQCEALDEALKVSTKKAAFDYLNELIAEEKLQTFNYDTQTLDTVTEFAEGETYLTLYVGEEK